MLSSKERYATDPVYAEQKRLAARSYYAKNRADVLDKLKSERASDGDAVRTKAREQWAKHGDKKRRWQNDNRQKNKETFIARDRAYHTAHIETRRLQARQSYAKHREKRAAESVNYKRTHPEKASEHQHIYRANRMRAPINDLTHAQWLEIKGAYDNRCAYCGKKKYLTQDHIQALSKNGAHTVQNIVPACRSCNSRKCDRPPLCPVQPLLLTIAPSKSLVTTVSARR